ncbi:MAG: DUF4239 domain-containing protein [Rhodospirillaceae bacterium]
MFAFIAVFGTVVAACFLLWITQRSRYSDFIKEFRGVVAPFIGIPGILFALNLVFLANDTWIAHDRAQSAVYQEASALSSIMVVAKLLPDPAKTNIMTIVKQYVSDVVDIEWDKLSRREIEYSTYNDIDALVSIVMDRSVSEEVNGNTHKYIISQLEKLKESHLQRVILSKTHINSLKWLSMAFLGFITMISIVMVHVDQVKAELIAVLIFASAATPTAVIVLIQGNPFQQPTALVSSPISCVVKSPDECKRLP